MDIHISFAKAMEKLKNAPENAIDAELIKECTKPRHAQMHKGDCGRLFVCGGSVGLTGAAVLAVRAALRCGCGLVTLGCCEELNLVFEIKLTEAMTLPLPSKDGKMLACAAEAVKMHANKSNAMLIGPGLSQSSELKELVYDAVKNCRVGAVLDADALNLISDNPDILKKTKAPIILTPHIGEFARLTGLSTDEIYAYKEKYALKFASDYGCITVLKSHRTVVAAPNGELYTNMLGNPGMATGGSGDVLAGAIASFLSQGCSPLKAALAGVYFHSLAADMAVCEMGEYSLLPTDIIKYLPYAIKETQGL